MNYYYGLLVFFGTISFLALLSYIIFNTYKQYKLKNILSQQIKPEFLKILKQIPLYNRLNKEDREKIHKSIMIFINTKEFIGIKTDVTDEMKVVIAFYACLLVLHLENLWCYENLKTILIYPHTVIAEQIMANGGIYTKGEFLLEGQSASDTMVISWHDAKKDAYHIHENNVIVHEFAHELDFLDGSADGTPPLPSSKYYEWTKILLKEYKKLQNRALKNRDWGKYKLLGSYAATNEAEFFAVATERYIEKPESLKKHFPELFKELNDFYKLYST